MKNKLKKLFRLGFALFAISLLLTNCENETQEEIQTESQEPTLILKQYSKQDIEKNQKLVSRLSEFNDKLTKNKSEKISARTVYNSEYDFTINTNLANYIENGDYHSYTFPLVQDDDEKMTNVLFELNDQGEYDAFLVKYDYTANEFNTLDLTSLSLQTSMEPIDLEFDSLTARTYRAYICIYSYERHCSDGWVNGSGGNLVGADNNNEGCYWVLVAEHCESVLYYDEDYVEYHNNNTATVTISGTNYGGTSGGSHTSPMPSPFNAEELMEINVVKSELELNHPERNWIDQYINGQYAFQLYDFGVANMWSDEAKLFGKSVVRDLMLDKKVDLEESFLSPLNVDLELVKPTVLNPEPEKVKFMCIFSKLTQSPTFKDLFLNTFGDNTRLHVKFKLDDTLPDNVGGTTGGEQPNQGGIIDGILNLNLLIRINKNHLNSTHLEAESSLEIAKNIMHEAIHAFLFVKKYSCEEGATLNILNNQLLGELINEYYDGSCSAGQEQHEFMFDYMIPTMETILNEIKDSLLSQELQSYVEQNTIINSSLGINQAWNWNDCFTNISYSGLDSATSFISEISDNPSNNFIYEEYKDLIEEDFSKECD